MPALWDAMASDGMASDGMDGPAVGLAMVTDEDGELSHRHGLVLEEDGAALGGMIAYRLPMTPEPADPDLPEAFRVVKELEDLIPGHWLISFLAVLPDARRQGLGTALLDKAEDQARASGCPGLALVVEASNTDAFRLYSRAGFRETTRRPLDLSEFGEAPTEALLMVKDLS